MATSAGRKTVGVSRGLMMLCDICYAQVIADKLTDEKNFVADSETLFDTICCGCTDINRPSSTTWRGSGAYLSLCLRRLLRSLAKHRPNGYRLKRGVRAVAWR